VDRKKYQNTGRKRNEKKKYFLYRHLRKKKQKEKKNTNIKPYTTRRSGKQYKESVGERKGEDRWNWEGKPYCGNPT